MFSAAKGFAGPNSPQFPASARFQYPALRRCLQRSHYLVQLKDVLKEQREFCDEVYLTSRCFAYLLNVKPGNLQGLLVLRASL